MLHLNLPYLPLGLSNLMGGMCWRLENNRGCAFVRGNEVFRFYSKYSSKCPFFLEDYDGTAFSKAFWENLLCESFFFFKIAWMHCFTPSHTALNLSIIDWSLLDLDHDSTPQHPHNTKLWLTHFIWTDTLSEVELTQEIILIKLY